VEVAVTGTAGEFEAFVVEQQRGLLRFAMTLTGDFRLSEELVADVFGALFERWDVVGRFDHPGAYARRALVNHFISQGRRHTRWQRVAPQVFAGHRPDSEDPSHEVSERMSMRLRLDGLPPRQRAVLSMRYYLDLPDEKIAEQLGCSPATVRSHAARGLAALRIELDDLDRRTEQSSNTEGQR
jgi:RNA polymerase sigma-70 factor (sigma-E family)